MPVFKKISKPEVPVNVDLAQILTEGTIAKPDQSSALEDAVLEDAVTEVTEEEFNSILNNLLQSQEKALQYNRVADAEFHVPYGLSVDKDMARALKTNNRLRALQYQEEISRYKSIFQRGMATTDFGVDYDKLSKPKLHRLMVNLFGNSADDARIDTQRYGALKELEKSLAEEQKRGINARFSVEPTDTPGFLDLSGFGGRENVQVNDYDLDVVVEGIELWEDRAADIPADGVPFGAALGMGYSSVLETEAMNSGVVATLSAIDENTTYIDSLFGLGPGDTITSDSGGRPQSYSFEEIYKNCFDCFLGAWNGDTDFKFNLDIELRLKELLDVIQDLLDAIKYALDLNGIILSNACSLMRLGVLCPIEIAFLIASLVALLRFTVGEVVLNFGGFLAQLVSALLLPLFNALELASNFAIAPFNIYVGCVMNTLLSAQQVAWTGAFTRQQMHDIANGSYDPRNAQVGEVPFFNEESPINTRIREGNQRRNIARQQRQEDRAVRRATRQEQRRQEQLSRVGSPVFPLSLEEQTGRDESFEGELNQDQGERLRVNIPPAEVERFKETMRELPGNVLSDILLSGGHSTNIDLQTWLSDRNLVQFTDPVEFYTLALIESNKKLTNVFLWIKNALAGLKAWAQANSIARLQLVAKITALSTLIGVLTAIARLLLGKVPICDQVPSSGGETLVVPRYTADEFLSIIGLPPLLSLETPTTVPGDATIIIDGEPVTPGSNQDETTLINTETGSRFTLVNCEKGKTRTVSNLELQATLRNLGIA